jgi:FAD/FMN-containing dehydrogenase
MSSLVRAFAGTWITADHPGYDDARGLWNAMIDRRPAVVARCTDAADVAAALRIARDPSLPVAVRGGGHSVPGHSCLQDGLVIDLSPMRGVRVDPDRRVARAQGGCLLSDLDQATQRQGLAVPAGAVSHTGIGGLTLGGGVGWMMRPHGLTIDNLVSAEVVLAHGEVTRTDEHHHPDLFWALRGGGGNFGVVTEFELRAHPRAMHHLGVAVHRLEEAAPVLRRWASVMADAPDDLAWNAFLRRLPGLFDWVPPQLAGEHVLLSAMLWSGDLTEGEKLIGGLLDEIGGEIRFQTPVPHVELQRSWDDVFDFGRHSYNKAGYAKRIDDAVIEVLLEQARRMDSPWSHLEVLPMGGAVSRVASDATAFPHRSSHWVYNLIAMWEPGPGEEHVSWVRETYDALAPHSEPGAYLNYMGGEERGGWEAAFAGHWDRLREIKTAYDPANVFSSNQNIPPLDRGQDLA